MKYLIAATLGLLLVNMPKPVFAQGKGFSTEDYDRGTRTRHGTYCKLALEGDTVYDGLCTISIKDSAGVSVIDIGRAKYKIVRDEFSPLEADFYRVGSNYSLDRISTTSRSPCWTGPSVRFCAK